MATCKEPYTHAASAYWVPLSKLVKNVTRAKAVDESKIFEGNTYGRIWRSSARTRSMSSRRRTRTRGVGWGANYSATLFVIIITMSEIVHVC